MNPDRRVVVYPQYLDSNKTVAEGRRIPKHLACDEPFINEIFDCCKLLKLEATIEGKHYPRDWLPRGRLRVQLKGEDGNPVNPDIPDRRTLLLKISELVPKHPQRAKGKPTLKPADAGASTGAGAGASGSSGSGAGASGSKPAPSKKGKKGKK